MRAEGDARLGRVLDVAVDKGTTVVTLRSGPAVAVSSPQGTRQLTVGAPITLVTRTAGPTAADVARCRPATANAADPSGPAAAAVDGSVATAWWSGTDPAVATSLTVGLAGTPTVSQATVTWQQARPLAPYTLQVLTAGGWRTVATVPPSAGDVDRIPFAAVPAGAVRVLLPAARYGGREPRLAELAVS